jgi:DNA-binding SARP family transcriptional activator/tetratricopeptide (TPR) repeat protein
VSVVGTRVEFRLLGPIEAWCEGQRVELGPPQQRGILAVLLTEANRTVSPATLMERIWADNPPASARSALYGHMTRIRAIVVKLNKDGELVQLRRGSGGYLLEVDPRTIDLHLFARLVDQARAAADTDQAATLWATALDLWRGQAYEGLSSPWLDEMRDQLERRRLDAALERNQVELANGRHTHLLPELLDLSRRQPLDERLASQLILAHYRAGRQAEALRHYQTVRRRLADELGVDPGPDLQALHEQILRNDPAVAEPFSASRERPVPAQLPPDVPGFVGRDRELAYLDTARAQLAVQPTAPAITAVSGPAGIGKTALAVHLAHSMAVEFPDGQLFVNLHGANVGVAPLAPVAVLGRFLRALGTPDLPTDVDEAAALFRSLTTGRRMLVVLDDAADEAQVRPLLPGAGGSAVVVSSRRVLSALDGVVHLRLGTLSERDALRLLSRLIGPDRVRDEPEAAMSIARFCGYLPLALRVCGARLVAHSRQTMAGFAGRLSDVRRRLDHLQHGDLAVRTSIAASRHDLDARLHGRNAFRVLELMALLETPDVSSAVVAALADASADEIQLALDQLTEAQLLQVAAPGRYRLHDLIRLYALEQAVAEIPVLEQHTALVRAFDHYAALGRRGTELLDPGLARWLRDGEGEPVPKGALESDAEVIAWMNAEHMNVVAAIRQAAGLPDGSAAAAIRLAAAMSCLLDQRGYWREWAEANETAAEVARRLGDGAAQARAAMFLGHCLGRMGRFEEELRHVEAALALSRDVGDRFGESGALNACGWAYLHQQRPRDAVTCFEHGLRLRRETGDRSGEAMLLNNLGIAYRAIGRIDRAIACHERATAIAREFGYRRLEAYGLGYRAYVRRLAGDRAQAVLDFDRSALLHRETGDRINEAAALWELGAVLFELGRRDQARDRWREALPILRDAGMLTEEEIIGILHTPLPTTPKAIELLFV